MHGNTEDDPEENLSPKKIKINNDLGEYECENSFTKLEHGILKIKFVLKKDEVYSEKG